MSGVPIARVRLGQGGEFDRIRSILGAGDEPAPRWLRVGPGDDCAVVDAGPLALTCDLTVEGVHFRRGWLSPREVGWRAAAVALSDLAGSAARPLGVLASVAAPADDAGDLAEVGEGIREAAASVGARLLGGDLTRSPGPLVVDVVAVGAAPRPVLRDGARPGHELWVTGRLGGAGGAVRAWEVGEEPAPALREAFARPRPRTEEALWLAERCELGALLDLSDGVAGDAGHMAAASGVRIVLEGERVPLHPELPAETPIEESLRDGEDYELLLAAPSGEIGPLTDAFRERFDLPLSRVGRVEAGEGVLLEASGGGTAPLGGGFDHFAPGGSG